MNDIHIEIYGLIILLMMLFVGFYVGIFVGEKRMDDRYSYIGEMIDECEKELPRNIKCKIIAVEDLD